MKEICGRLEYQINFEELFLFKVYYERRIRTSDRVRAKGDYSEKKSFLVLILYNLKLNPFLLCGLIILETK